MAFGREPNAESREQTMHVSVLPAEVLEHLAPQPGQTVVDATAGAGGHARLIAERLGPTGRLIVLDRDAGMLEIARRRLEGVDCRVTFMHANFDTPRDVLHALEIAAVDGVLPTWASARISSIRRSGLQLPAGGPAGHADGHKLGRVGRQPAGMAE